jgi:hypothetical protein
MLKKEKFLSEEGTSPEDKLLEFVKKNDINYKHIVSIHWKMAHTLYLYYWDYKEEPISKT